MIALLEKYFPDITKHQQEQFANLADVYREWNAKINVISRKDIDAINEKHILHSLAIAKVQAFLPDAKVLDVGTGGGFPGIPLAILFPQTQFHLIDSIGKKIQVVEQVAKAIDLQNIQAQQCRAQEVGGKYDFVVSRAVTQFDEFYQWVKNRISSKSKHVLPNGILYLKGGDLDQELYKFRRSCQIFSIPDFFDEAFFETKKVVYYSPYAAQ